MSEKKLKPCPFCGGEAIFEPVNSKFYVRCVACGIESDWFSSKEKAIEFWNERYQEPDKFNAKNFIDSCCGVKPDYSLSEKLKEATNELVRHEEETISNMLKEKGWNGDYSNITARLGAGSTIFMMNGEDILRIAKREEQKTEDSIFRIESIIYELPLGRE